MPRLYAARRLRFENGERVSATISVETGLPVHAVGVGEGIEDLQPFTARDYARSLVGLSA